MGRSLAFVLATALLVGVPAAARPASGATVAACSVVNARTGASTDTLQASVDASAKGDTLLIQGTCVGKTRVSYTSLRLLGVPTVEQPTPTLDASGMSRVLDAQFSSLTVRNLTITNGRSRWAAGILLRDCRLLTVRDSEIKGNTASWNGGGITALRTAMIILSGSTSVAGNTAKRGAGGGIISSGELILRDFASVTGNRANQEGGGILSLGKLVLKGSVRVAGNSSNRDGGGIASSVAILMGSASVTGNTATYRGGGIDNGGTLTLKDSASVSGNTAARRGGGIDNPRWASVILEDFASVTQNTAGVAGGGIFNEQGTLHPHGHVYVCSDLVAISPNDPDDPPRTESCP